MILYENKAKYVYLCKGVIRLFDLFGLLFITRILFKIGRSFKFGKRNWI